MIKRIGSDSDRFKQIIKNKVKHNLGKYIGSNDLTSQKDGKLFKIPIDVIDTPRFTYGGQNGGAGQGSGNPGDPMDGSKKKDDGKAGNEKGEHQYSAEFTKDELAQILGEELQLPDIEEKCKGKVDAYKSKYSGINKVGAEGLRHFRRTYKQALLRNISSGSYNPADPHIIPIRDDKRYRSATPISKPENNIAIIYIRDVSGSITQEMCEIIKSEIFWIDAWLSYQYKSDIETRFLVHDTESSEVDREQFFSIKESGGTEISSAYKHCANIIKENYPFSEFNTYIFHFTDSDNWSYSDSYECVNILKSDILPSCNTFCYGHVKSEPSGDFLEVIQKELGANDKVQISLIPNKGEILKSIKEFLGKGK